MEQLVKTREITTIVNALLRYSFSEGLLIKNEQDMLGADIKLIGKKRKEFIHQHHKELLAHYKEKIGDRIPTKRYSNVVSIFDYMR